MENQLLISLVVVFIGVFIIYTRVLDSETKKALAPLFVGFINGLRYFVRYEVKGLIVLIPILLLGFIWIIRNGWKLGKGTVQRFRHEKV